MRSSDLGQVSKFSLGRYLKHFLLYPKDLASRKNVLGRPKCYFQKGTFFSDHPLHIVNWDTTIFLLSLIIFIYLTLQHNSNKHKSKLLQWNLESAVKCMKILRDVIGTHIPTLILGTWNLKFTAHWELRFPHVHWELGFPENFWEWHTFGNFAQMTPQIPYILGGSSK